VLVHFETLGLVRNSKLLIKVDGHMRKMSLVSLWMQLIVKTR